MSTDDTFALTHPVVGRDGGDKLDYYPTPTWCTELLFKHGFEISNGHWPTVRSVLDPAAGDGAILDVARKGGFATLGLELDPVRVEAARAKGHQMGTGDALARSWPRADMAVMNPPYLRAESFVRKGLEWRRGMPGYPPLFALLRLSFLEPTQSRRDLLGAHRPNVLILPRRPSFDGIATDNITSAWFCWPGQGRLVWLPP